jgi:hypothetical protein
MTTSTTQRPVFRGLKLSDEDKLELKRISRSGPLKERQWRRIQILRLLHRGDNLSAIGRALSTHPREVRRVGWRYVERGLGAALSDERGYVPPKKLDATQKSAIVAMVCSAPPEGHGRWSLRLLARQAKARGVVDDDIGHVRIKEVLDEHDIKPWREKNVVRAKARRGIS